MHRHVTITDVQVFRERSSSLFFRRTPFNSNSRPDYQRIGHRQRCIARDPSTERERLLNSGGALILTRVRRPAFVVRIRTGLHKKSHRIRVPVLIRTDASACKRRIRR